MSAPRSIKCYNSRYLNITFRINKVNNYLYYLWFCNKPIKVSWESDLTGESFPNSAKVVAVSNMVNKNSLTIE